MRRTGWSQFALCGSGPETSFWGLFVREAGLCPKNVNPKEHNFRVCDDKRDEPAHGQEWYTLCGSPMDSGAHAWLALHAALAASSILFALTRGTAAAKRAAAAPPPAAVVPDKKQR